MKTGHCKWLGEKVCSWWINCLINWRGGERKLYIHGEFWTCDNTRRFATRTRRTRWKFWLYFPNSINHFLWLLTYNTNSNYFLIFLLRIGFTKWMAAWSGFERKQTEKICTPGNVIAFIFIILFQFDVYYIN